jgi:uncharacterized protein (DUF983 family)
VPPLTVSDPAFLREHQQALIQRQRCPRCAERAPASRILRGETCGRCGVRLRLDASDDHAREVLVALQAGWEKTRILVYGSVLVATFLTGLVPMVAAVATTIAMTLANVLLIRNPLQWLPPTRRVWSWLRIDAWFAILTVVSFVLNAVAATMLVAAGAGAMLSAFTGFLITLLYIEGALSLVASEVERASKLAVAPSKA